MYEALKKHNLSIYNLDRKQYQDLNADRRAKIDWAFNFMEQEGLVKKEPTCTDIPFSYSITSLGIKIVEGHAEKPSIASTIYNIGTATNSIIGDNAHNNIINTGIPFSELQTLIEQNFPNQLDQKEILHILKDLQEKIDSGKPLEKGILSTINNKLQNCSWLSSAIAARVLQYLSGII